MIVILGILCLNYHSLADYVSASTDYMQWLDEYLYEKCFLFKGYVGAFGAGEEIGCKPPESYIDLYDNVDECGSGKVIVENGITIVKPCKAITKECPSNHEKDSDKIGCWPTKPVSEIPECGDHEFYVRSGNGGLRCQYDWETDKECRAEASSWWKPDEFSVSASAGEGIKVSSEAKWKTDLLKVELEYKQCMDENRINH